MSHRALAAERDYLRIHRDQKAEAVEAINRLIDSAQHIEPEPQPAPPRSPHTSPVQIGVLDFFDNPYVSQEVSWRLIEVGNRRLVIMMDRDAYNETTAQKAEELANAFRDALEPR